MPDLTNMQKYANYKEQMERLNRAMKDHFFLGAMFIEYAVMEDRCESILTHAGVFRPDRHNTIVLFGYGKVISKRIWMPA